MLLIASVLLSFSSFLSIFGIYHTKTLRIMLPFNKLLWRINHTNLCIKYTFYKIHMNMDFSIMNIVAVFFFFFWIIWEFIRFLKQLKSNQSNHTYFYSILYPIVLYSAIFNSIEIQCIYIIFYIVLCVVIM